MKNSILRISAVLGIGLSSVFYSIHALGQYSNCEELIGTGEWSNNYQTFSYYLPQNTNLLYPDSSWLPCPYNQACKPVQETMAEYCDRTYYNRSVLKASADSYRDDSKEYKNYRCENNTVVEMYGVTSYTNFDYSENNCTSKDTALYGDLSSTIKYYTDLSIRRSSAKPGFSVDRVEYVSDYKQFKVSLSVEKGTSQDTVKTFSATHQKFLCIAAQGLNGINQCKDEQSYRCWQPKFYPDQALTSANYPWTFFLPLGMPMTNQKIVNFLNYPPFDALDSADYMKNFTMCRWNSVLLTAGIPDNETFLYETIVDSHPIAAPGSGQQHALPDATQYFNTPPYNYYDTPMVELFARSGQSTTLPILVLGTDARAAWAKFIGLPELNYNPVTKKPFEQMPYVGTFVKGSGQEQMKMPWIASNHPDVTTYNCCAGDVNGGCSGGSYGNSWSLLQDEGIDLTAICVSQTLSDNPGMDPLTARSSCQKQWTWTPDDSSGNNHKICVQAKMDYNFTAKGQCETLQDAVAYCNHFNNNPCPTDISPNPNLLPDPNKAAHAKTNLKGAYTCEIPTLNK